MSGKFTLGKLERLKSRKRIGQLFSDGKTMVSGFLKLFYRESGEGLHFGAGVSTKNFKKATDRNRIKRLLRESWRVQKNSLEEKLREKKSGFDVFIIYTGKDLPQYKEVADQVNILMIKLEKKIL